MSIFNFGGVEGPYHLGRVREVDTRRALVLVERDEDLRKAQVGQLVAVRLSGGLESWLISHIDKVRKSVAQLEVDTAELKGLESDSDGPMGADAEREVNTVTLTLLGTVTLERQSPRFSRSLIHLPNIDAECYLLKDAQLEAFMALLSTEGDTAHSLELGHYALDPKATAFVDGNRLFQRHAALLGSTGSGKSWTVASILERAASLPASNLLVFDIHGEYRALSYASQLRIPGPEELGKSGDGLLYLPYWLLNVEELQAMFIDRTEFTAQNQVMAFQDAVIEEKRRTLTDLGKVEVLKAFTLDSPVPFDLGAVIGRLKALNEELVQGARGLKHGHFFGQFNRLLARLRSKLSDRRYGFLYQAPQVEHRYDTMAILAARLMDFVRRGQQVKVINFSEVPSDILPIIVGLVARIVFQLQFWTDHEQRHPLALVCDEAHLYLPKKEGRNPVEQRAIENFEKIAKEGRKYGVALLIVSQRPSDVSATVLSQCNNVIALRLTNGEDQATLRHLMPESLESLMDILPAMDIGEALVVGDAVLLPSRIKIRPPTEKPLSATIDFWSRWVQAPGHPDFVGTVENMRCQSRK